MKTLLFFILFLTACHAMAQDFVTRGKVEYEKKETLRDAPQQMRDIYGGARTNYFDLVFADDKSIYKTGAAAPPPTPGGRNIIILNNNNNSIFTNFKTNQVVRRKNVYPDDYIFEDSLPPIEWKIGQETRRIAGYECRKAVGRFNDSFYVVAFYAEEIVIKGGPEGFHGLPGLILGLAMPRMHTTWFATKVELASIDESSITAPSLKGKKLSREETKAKLIKSMEQYTKDAKKAVEYYFKPQYFLDY